MIYEVGFMNSNSMLKSKIVNLKSPAKPILLSGMQPTGRLHLGNYLGALKNWIDLQASGKYQCYFLIVDLHALTQPQKPEELRANIINLAADYLAAGIDPKKSILFVQSQIPAHSELAWILNTITQIGELDRMTQFKEKSGIAQGLDKLNKEIDELVRSINSNSGPTNTTSNLEIGKKIKSNAIDALAFTNAVRGQANTGLFTYPILMAADIILYDAAFVPVGDDQLQHLELTRTLVRKFNSRFGETFVEPKPLLTETPRVMNLSDPMRKMSKSEPAGCLFLDDSPTEVETKVKRAVTDSGSEVKFDEEKKPAIANLLRIYASLSGETIPKLEKQFASETYSYFKSKLAELITSHFAEFRKKKVKLVTDQSSLIKMLRAGSTKAAKVAEKKIAEVKEKIGITVN